MKDMDPKELEILVRRQVEKRLAADRDKPIELDGIALSVLTEQEIRDAGPGGHIVAAADAIVTPAARDLARAWGVTIQRGAQCSGRVRRVAVGADHGGFELKEEVKKLLQTMEKVEIFDLGTHGKETVDYPDFALAVAEAVCSGRADLGIMVDGAGIGSAMTANKVPGARAAMCYDAASARNAREHNFANVLTMGGRVIDAARMREIVTTFLETPTGGERHAARVRKIMEIERKYCKI
jgi:ribose 5-phosphate isomerase B